MLQVTLKYLKLIFLVKKYKENEFIDTNKKLKYAKLKYDLNELFTNTPLFDVPPANYDGIHGIVSFLNF